MTHADAQAGHSREQPYGLEDRFHLQHVHLFASNIEVTIEFYSRWFGARVVWDGEYGGARNVFMKIGIGAMHLYEQAPRELGRNAVHHLGMQVIGLRDVYERMKDAGIELPNPIQEPAAIQPSVRTTAWAPASSAITVQTHDTQTRRQRCCAERSLWPSCCPGACWLRHRIIPAGR
jgi:predicted enzyme related to lactoylglutathione lyase